MENIDNEIDKLVNAIDRNLKSADRVLDKKLHTESIAMDALGLIISVPFILKIVGTTLKAAQSYVFKNKGNDQVVADYIIKFADKLHHKLEYPFIKLASKFTDDPNRQKLFATVLLSGLIGVLMIGNGTKMIHYIDKVNVKKSIVYSLETLIKGTELKNVITVLVDILRKTLNT